MDASAEMTRKLTVKQARALFKTEWWKHIDLKEAAILQLHQDRLCMPFSIFHAAIETLLSRPVWTHEFAGRAALIAEAEGKRPAPASPLESLAEIVGPEKTASAIAIKSPENRKI